MVPPPVATTFESPAPLPMKEPAVNEYPTVADPIVTLKLDVPTENAFPVNVPVVVTKPHGSTITPFVANTATDEEFTPSGEKFSPLPVNAALTTAPVEMLPDPDTFTPLKPEPFPANAPA